MMPMRAMNSRTPAAGPFADLRGASPALLARRSSGAASPTSSVTTRGPPGLDADDVATASARQERGGGRWEVEFTLTAEGSSRLGMFRRDSGPEGRVALLVDGQVVAVPILADGPAAGGIVPGPDEATARRLVDRLRR
jgi:preprotein translocase subunit SecD